MIRNVLALGALAAVVSGCGYHDCDEPGAICTVAGTGRGGLGLDGMVATEADLYWPSDLTVGPDGNPWILDWNNHRIVTVDLSAEEPTLDVITGNAMVGDGPFDVPLEDALWNHPTNILFEDGGTFLFAAWHNSRVIRIDPVGGTIEHIAGNGQRTFNGDGGPALLAAFDLPVGLAYGEDGRLYVADQANQRVRCIEVDQTIGTVVGNGNPTYAGDGGAALEASLQSQVSQNADPGGRIAIDGTTMYIADTLNNRIRIVDMVTWTIDTYAGDGSEGGPETGDALTSGLYWPRDVEIGPDGSVYVADSENHCVRRIFDGEIETVAGICGVPDVGKDNRLATDSNLVRPLGIDVGPDGALWIADSWTHRIRRVAPLE